MRINSDSAAEAMKTAWQRLDGSWHGARSTWRDSVRDHFEQEFWHEFKQIVLATLEEMRRLNDVIARAQREVR